MSSDVRSGANVTIFPAGFINFHPAAVIFCGATCSPARRSVFFSVNNSAAAIVIRVDFAGNFHLLPGCGPADFGG
jgi:hypothetical protein